MKKQVWVELIIDVDVPDGSDVDDLTAEAEAELSPKLGRCDIIDARMPDRVERMMNTEAAALAAQLADVKRMLKIIAGAVDSGIQSETETLNSIRNIITMIGAQIGDVTVDA